MKDEEILAKVERNEGLTEEEVLRYQELVPPVKHVYGKYGTMAKIYMEQHNVAKLWSIVNLPEYLHGIDRQADEMYEVLHAKLSKSERFRRTGNFMDDYQRQNEMKNIIEQEILNELVYVD